MKNKFFGILLAIVIVGSFSACGEKDPCEKGHTWKEATCAEPKTCEVCDATEGDPLEHEWEDATCVEPQKCKNCESSKGEALGHSFGEPQLVKDSTCSEAGQKRFTCSVCGEIKDEEIPKKAHTPGEWEIVVQATATTKGKKAQKCSVCKGTIQEEEFEKSAAEIKADYKLNCANYTYNEISRNPENYRGKYAHFKGKIIQSMESGDTYTFRINITKTKYSWTDTILVTYTKKEATESRLLEDDIVNIYGMLSGTYTYETVMGNEMTIPLLLAEYVELN